jgi:very-short-patch-repair endonuclease
MDSAAVIRHGAPMLEEVFALAASQHGLVTRGQLRERRVDRARVARWVHKGLLRIVDVNTLAISGAPRTERQALMAAVLETGHDASASHTTAAALWGLGGYRLEPTHVVVTRISRHHHRLAWSVHQLTGLVASHRRWIDNIPVTSPALTMLHLASMVSLDRLRRSVDNAWSLGLITGADLRQLDADMARNGRDGIVNLRKVASERGEEWVPPQSNIESRFDRLMTSVGLSFERQVRIETEAWAARVDFLHRLTKTIVEVQSERYHTALTDAEADRIRRDRLAALGYTVVEVWDNEIFQVPNIVVDRVRQAIVTRP